MLRRAGEPWSQQTGEHVPLRKEAIVPGRVMIDEGDRLVGHGMQAITPRR